MEETAHPALVGRAWTSVLDLPSPDRRVVVIGGDPMAAWWVRDCVRLEREVVVLARRICDDLLDLLVEHRIDWQRRDPVPGDLDEAWAVHVATADEGVAASVRGWIGARRHAT
ncbi:MAG: NAD(P)-dependent oxidoreductase [Nostocoides sp.]